MDQRAPMSNCRNMMTPTRAQTLEQCQAEIQGTYGDLYFQLQFYNRIAFRLLQSAACICNAYAMHMPYISCWGGQWTCMDMPCTHTSHCIAHMNAHTHTHIITHAHMYMRMPVCMHLRYTKADGAMVIICYHHADDCQTLMVILVAFDRSTGAYQQRWFNNVNIR